MEPAVSQPPAPPSVSTQRWQTRMPSPFARFLRDLPLALLDERKQIAVDDAGDALKRMRELTDNYSIPDHACNTYRALFDSLEQLEYDMHRHVHKENSILFPRAVEAEAKLSA